MPRPKLFLDSSAVIAAALSSREDSPGRQLLLLGEAGVVDLRISREVLSDLERLYESATHLLWLGSSSCWMLPMSPPCPIPLRRPWSVAWS